MYLDPGSASLFIQSVFAGLAMVLATFNRSRVWIVAVWSRAVAGVGRMLRRRNS
jgi:hypothetical protein